jgi:phosphatidate cytidylyltransferase
MAGELPRRFAVAVVGIPVVLGCLALGGWVLGVLIALAAVFGTREFYALSQAAGGTPFVAAGSAAAGGLVLLAVPAATATAPGWAALLLLVGLSLVALTGAVWLRGPDHRPLSALGDTLAGVLYVGGALAFVPLLRSVPVETGPEVGAEAAALLAGLFVLFPLVVVWVGDSAAYFVGRAVGRRQLASAISPGKTVEGALAGLAGSGAAGALLGGWAAEALAGPQLSAWMGLTLGVLVGAAGQVGDLAESVLKREAHVKDSGRLLPGHGGMLDRLDALLFAFPVTWAFVIVAGLL